MQNAAALEFIQKQAPNLRYLTSICTGSIVLGAAGLLKGKTATSHWSAVDFLSRFGAVPSHERIVRDGNLITAGGVTSGIDFGLVIVAELFGKETAQKVQLMLQYAPQPPFQSGTPDEADKNIIDDIILLSKNVRQQREDIIQHWEQQQ